MSRPTEVLVKVEDLERIKKWWEHPMWTPSPGDGAAFQSLLAAIPEPEWEPSEEQIRQLGTVEWATPDGCVRRLKALHEAGLL